MTALNIVFEYLKKNGFDGLCSDEDEECVCTLKDFVPCGYLGKNCFPAYLHESPETCPSDCEQRCFDNGYSDNYLCDKEVVKK